MLKKFSAIIILQSSFLFFPHNLLACMSASVSTGIEALSLGPGKTIKIDPNVDPQCINDSNDGKDVLCLPHSKMTFEIKNKKIDLTHLVKKWDECYVYFVKIRKNKYLADLNDDGRPEIAILPMLSGGGAIILTAYLYTVLDEGLRPFGEGRFFWEDGDLVKLGCPGCWKFDLEKCNSCY